MKVLSKFLLTLAISCLAMSAKAQLFFHKDGYYQKDNNHWTEYKITKEDNNGKITEYAELDRFIEYSEDESYYYIDSGKYKVSVPKTVGYSFYILPNDQAEFTELYVREEFRPIEYRDCKESDLGCAHYTIYDNGKAEFNQLYTDETWYNILDRITVNNQTYVVDVINAFVGGDTEKFECLIIPNTVTKIVKLWISDDCKKLKTLKIPGSVTDISNDHPFGYSSPIEEIIFEGSTPYEYSLSLRDMPKLKTITTYRPFTQEIWVTNSKKFKKVLNYSGHKIIVRDYLDRDPKYY